MIKAMIRTSDDGEKTLSVEMPVGELRKSGSGKTEIVAATGRPRKSIADVDGRPIYINLLAFVYPDRST